MNNVPAALLRCCIVLLEDYSNIDDIMAWFCMNTMRIFDQLVQRFLLHVNFREAVNYIWFPFAAGETRTISVA